MIENKCEANLELEQDKTREYCLECGNELNYGGRSDRKFCSSQCKNNYHNRNIRDERLSKLRIKNILEKNYKILSKLLKLEVSSIDLADLGQLGYNFEYVTSYHRVRDCNEFRCFDIKYLQNQDSIFDIKRFNLHL